MHGANVEASSVGAVDRIRALLAGTPARRDGVVVACGVGLFWFLYTQVSLLPSLDDGWVETNVLAVADGDGFAPFQFRFLVPVLEAWLIRDVGIGSKAVIGLVDLAGLAITAWCAHRVARKVPTAVSPSALCGLVAWFALGSFWYHQPDTFVTLAAASVVIAAGVGAAPVAPAVAAGLVLAGGRTDVLLALGMAALWDARRRAGGRRRIAGVVMISVAVLATVCWRLRWPDAEYLPGNSPFMLVENVVRLWVLVPILLLAPIWLQALFLGVDQTFRRLRRVPGLEAGLVGFAVLGAMTSVAGQLQEVRILAPFAIVLALATVTVWADTALDEG